MEYVEFRVRVEDTKNILAWRQNQPPVRGEVRLEPLQRQTIRVLSRWVADDKIEQRGELALLGSHLFGVLFTDKVAAEFEEAYRKKADAVLRIVLEFLPAARELATLPWEYLYYPDNDETGRGFFIAAQHRLILSRHVPLKLRDEALKSRVGALRLLLVVSRPQYDRVEEEHEGERASVRKPMGDVKAQPVIQMLEDLQKASAGRISVDTLLQPDKRMLTDALIKLKPDVVHFIGHGRYKGDAGALAFVRKTVAGDTEAAWLSDTAFADCFGEITPPRLIFLHACEGARSDSYEAFSGVSLQLVYSRMPAVIAMQYPIPNDVAIAFARSLYRALSEGQAIDEAVQHGRSELGVYLDDEENFSSRAFGSPVVFLQSKDAHSLEGIVTVAEPAGGVTPTPPVTERQYRCPNPACRGQINPDRRFCPNPKCRRPFKICTNPSCREAIADEATFCDSCNTDVAAAAAASATPAAAVRVGSF